MRRPIQAVLLILSLTLAGCSPLPGSRPSPTSQPVLAVATTVAPSPVPADSRPSAAPIATPATLPAATSSPVAAAVQKVREPVPFFAGLPAGDLYNPSDMAVDPSAGRAYVCGRDGQSGGPALSTIELSTMKIVSRVTLEPAGSGVDCRDLASAGGRLFALMSPEQTVYEVNLDDGSLRVLNGQADEMALAPEGQRIYLAGAGRLEAIDALLRRSLWLIPLESPLQLLRISEDGTRLAAVQPGSPSRLVTFSAGDGKLLRAVDVPDFVTHFSTGPDGGWAAVLGGAPPRLIRYDAELAEVGRAEVPYAAGMLYDTQRHRFLLTTYREDPEIRGMGRRVVLALDADSLAAEKEVTQPSARKGGDNQPAFDVLDLAPNGNVLGMARYGAAAVYELDAVSLTPLRRTIAGVRLTGLAVDTGRSRLFAADDHDRLHVFDLNSGKLLDLWDGGAPIAVDEGSGRIYANRADGVVALDSGTGSVLAAFDQGGAIAPDPARDLVYLVDAGVSYFDRSGKLLGRLASTYAAPMGTAMNPFAVGAKVVGADGSLAVTLHNGVSGSNAGSFLRLYPAMSDNPVAPDSSGGSIMDVIAGAGETGAYLSYSPTRGMEGIVRLDASGGILTSLAGRTGLLAVDERRQSLYAALEGTLSRMDANSLAVEQIFPFPPMAEQVIPDWAGDRIFVRTAAGSRIEVVELGELEPVVRSPLPEGPFPPANVGALSVRPGPGRPALYAHADNLLYRSYDAVSWQQLRPTVMQGMGYLTVAADGSLFYAAQGAQGAEGVLRSTDAGDSWEVLAQGLEDLRANQPVLAASDDRAVFVSRTAGAYAWNPGQKQWQRIWAQAQAYDPAPQLSLAPDGVLYLTSGATIERSADDGQTWQVVDPLPGGGQVVGFESTGADQTVVFGLSCADGCELYRATAPGKKWKHVLSLAGYPFGVRVTEVGDALVLLGSGYQELTVHRSPDGGLTWLKGTHPGLAEVFAGLVDAGGRVWLGRQGRVDWMSLDDITWVSEP